MNKSAPSEYPFIICRLPDGKWGKFSDPKKILSLKFSELKNDLKNMEQLFSEVESAVKNGCYVAGYMHYEAAIAFDKAYCINEQKINDNIPVVAFGIFDKSPTEYNFPDNFPENIEIKNNQILTSKNAYIKSIKKLKIDIYSGEIYQANYTVRSKFDIEKYSLFDIFNYLNCSHPVPYSAYVNLFENYEITSISPELFFEKYGDKLTSLPMKGTMARHYNYEIDKKNPNILANDKKNCAENVMICDMVRNDIGKIAEAGSVKVEKLFHVDTYNTLHQMISKVSGVIRKDNNNFYEIFKALFPAASITGAPKVRAMQIISELETSSRGVYTGTIGCICPNGDALFNVPIRTLFVDNTNSEKINLSIGSGVVADSDSNDEWDELLNKSEFITKSLPLNFKIFSTLLYNLKFINAPFRYLNEHLRRLENSQCFFKRKFCDKKIIKSLTEFQQNIGDKNQLYRVKIILDQNGDVEIISTLLTYKELRFTIKNEPLRLKLSSKIIDSKNILLYHKTTAREFYDHEFMTAKEQGADEVIFTNEKGFVTEGAISNIFLKKDGKWFTPHQDCGLLNGIMRAKLIEKLHAKEDFLTVDNLKNADEIIICNAVRGIGKNCDILYI